jgi:hypothetical protein
MNSNRILGLLLGVALAVAIPPSCKKAVDNIQQNAINDIITNGRWTVTRFEAAGVSKTAEYAGFEFQFFDNGVVTAFKDGSSNVNGKWSANIENITVTAEFPGQGDPLKRFNTIWFITRITETIVQARASVAGEEYILGLLKK